jgi:hypothetical protein
MGKKKTVDGVITRPTSWPQDDAKWFERRPDRTHRVRDRFPGEEFGSKNDPALVVSHD